jgi:xylose isomerase
VLKAKLAVLASTWSKHGDRWMLEGYHEGMNIREAIERAGSIEGIEGIELVHPQQINGENAGELFTRISEAGLGISSIANSISGRSIFYRGALTSKDPRVRREAIDTVKRGLDLAAELEIQRTNLWLGREGFDYPFQVDYEECWDLLIRGLSECASHQPGVMICIEYKLREPRAHLLAGTANKTLSLIREVGADNVGVLLDTGHCLFAYENIAETIFLLHRAGKLFHFHLNDNHRIEDDDMLAGSIHFYEFLEALYWLDRIGYEGWISLDPHPLGEDETRSVEEGVRFCRGACAMLQRIGPDRLGGMLKDRQAMDIYREFQREIFHHAEG